MKIYVIRFFYVLLLVFQPAHSVSVWEEYPIVRDKRNFKEAAGGKGVPAQGRILEDSTKSLLLSPPRTRHLQMAGERKIHWNYVVSMNCVRGESGLVEKVQSLSSQLLPTHETDRLGIIVGINEHVGIKEPLGYSPAWDDILGGENGRLTLENLGIPILIVYYQWTAFREHTTNKELSASGVRQRVVKGIESIASSRRKAIATARILKEDKAFQFPFGCARAHLLNNSDSQMFLSEFSQKGWKTYIHIQDSDFVSLREKPSFCPLPSQEGVTAGGIYLLQIYDSLLSRHLAMHGKLPIIAGGAHTYSVEENVATYMDERDLSHLDTTSSKQWTRFGSEMGNYIKHLIGLENPFGLYFHEPNTLVLSPGSASTMMKEEKDPERRTVLGQLSRGVVFGISSEVQEFTRDLFKGCSVETCCKGMVFSALTLLSTSVKRGDKPFTVFCGGEYDERAQTFSGVCEEDLSRLRGMSQEIIQPSKWRDPIATGFSDHRVSDARTELTGLYQIFDPTDLLIQRGFSAFGEIVIHYEEYLRTQIQRIHSYYARLSSLYNKQGQGSGVAQKMVSMAWECGQMSRFMILDYVNPSLRGDIKPKGIGIKAREFLAQRIRRNATVDNPFVVEILLTPQTPKVIRIRLKIPPYTEKKFVALVAQLKDRVEKGEMTKKELTEWAGYSGHHVSRDFRTLCEGKATKKQSRWESLMIATLKAGITPSV